LEEGLSLTGKPRKFLIFTLAIFLLLSLLVSVRWIWLPRILDSQDVKAAICKEIERATGYVARLEYLELASLSLVEIRGRGLTLESPSGGNVLVIPQVAVELRWKDLLAGQVLLRSMILDGLEMDQPELLLLEQGKSEAGLQRLGHIKLRNSTLRWVFAGEKLLVLQNITADLHMGEEGQTLDFWLKGDMRAGTQNWPVQFRGRLEPSGSGKALLECESVSLEELSGLLLPPQEADRVVGKAGLRVELQRGSNGQLLWDGYLEAKELRVNWPKVLEIPFEAKQLKAHAKGIWERGYWSIQEGRIKSQELSLEGQLSNSVHGLTGFVRAGSFSFRKVIPYLDRELIGPALYGFFREELLGGEGKGAVFRLLPEDQGSNGGANRLVMELEFEEASLRFDPRLPPLENLAGTLVWQGDRVWFKNLKAQYRNRAFIGMEARITEIGRVSLLEGSFSLELAWPELEELFSAVAPSRAKGALLSKVEGSSVLDLTLRKAFLRKDPLYYEAKIRINGAWGELPGVPPPWKVDSGEITATPKKVEIGSLKGTWSGSWWEAAGSMQNWGDERPNLSLKGKMGIPSELLQAAFLQILPGMEIVKAENLPLDFSIQGYLQEATARLQADLSPTELVYKELWEKPLGEPLDVELVLEGSLGGEWNLQEARARYGVAYMLISSPGSGEVGLWNFQLAPCPTEELVKHWPVLRGKLEGGEVEIKGRVRSKESISWDANISAREVRISQEVAGSSLLIRSGRFQLNPTGITAESAQIEMESQQLTFSGSIQAAQEQKFKIQGGLRGEALDLDGFLARRSGNNSGEKGSESGKRLKEWIDKLEESQMGLAFRSMKFLGLDFTGVQARMLKKGHGISLEGYVGHLAGGEVSMGGNLNPEGMWSLKGTLKGARSAEFFAALGLKEALIEGTLGIKVDIQGGTNNDPPSRYRGMLNLEIEKGLIRRFPVLASVLSMMNLSQLFTGRLPDLSSEGMVFKSIRGTFQLDQGVLRTEDLRVESEAVVITMVGDIDLRTRQCDLKVGVQPFVGVDRFVDKLPIIRHYLAGPKRTVLATYFLVTGPLDQPEVNAVPFRSLGQTVMEMFLRLFQNPFGDLGPPGELPPEPEAPYGAR